MRGMMDLAILLYTAPVGLMLDIVGFLLIIRYGHSLFLRVVPGDLPDRQDHNLYLRADGIDEQIESRRRLYARIGVVAVVVGFGLQIIGSTAAIILCV